MNQTIQTDDDDDLPPGEGETADYHATTGRRGGGRGEYLWFVTNRGYDLIFALADLRRMEAPSNPAKEIAYLHFSGVTVALAGTGLRRVLHRITMQGCSAIHELRPMQRRPAAGEPVVERIEYLDMTQPKLKEGAAKGDLPN